ncbi:hypothetical protein M885DRAFT_564021 [Pelagophyceae sp. CCMP2097]|nr:hypothetical protein M885DRAFT_564021 [Pelagophyceae sp. CCMP2097]
MPYVRKDLLRGIAPGAAAQAPEAAAQAPSSPGGCSMAALVSTAAAAAQRLRDDFGLAPRRGDAHRTLHLYEGLLRHVTDVAAALEARAAAGAAAARPRTVDAASSGARRASRAWGITPLTTDALRRFLADAPLR